MSFRSDSLFSRLTEPQRDELMICIMDFGQVTVLKQEDETAPRDRFSAGLELCRVWGIKTSRTAVHDFFKRYNFGWRLERGAWAAKHTEGMSDFEEQQRKLVAQKLFAEAADTDADPKFLLFLRGLELEQDKIAQRERLAENRGTLEKEKLKLADRRVKVLEDKIEKASAKLKELRDPKKADDATTRQAILDAVDEAMGIKKKK